MFLEVSCYFIMFVHDPPYQTVEVCCNLVFTMVLPTWATIPFCVLEWDLLRLTLIMWSITTVSSYHYVAWVSTMPWIVKLQRLQSSILGWHSRPYHENERHRLWSVHIRLVWWTMLQWIKLWRSLTLCLFGMCSEHHQQYRLQTKTA